MTESEWGVYDDMNLYITSDEFFIEPIGKSELLIIDRLTNTARVEAKVNQVEYELPVKRVCGVLGSIRLIAGQYLIVATYRVFVGIVNGSVVWRLAGYDIIPYIPTSNHLTPTQRDQNETYLNMLKKTLDTPYFYFSYVYDLTHSFQRLNAAPMHFSQQSLLDRADKRFVWNGQLLGNFGNSELKRFALPIMLGFVSINHTTVNNNSFSWTIVSRRSVDRAGTRLFCRGIDENGHCANFVETEQIIEFNSEKVSFVQTRGSMPFYWRQTPNLRYKPPPELISGMDHVLACMKHFDDQLAFYGRQVLVNLVDQKGAEGDLEKAYSTIVSQLNNSSLRYEAFDFHSECKKMRYDRLQILIDRLAFEQDQFGVFHKRDDGVLLTTQTGVFRTNCIDCLDRTNVVQSMLARRSLGQVFAKLGILPPGQSFQNASQTFESLFKNVWADNADMISLQYSGTGALKTDFTRTGKRTKAGLAQDGINSLTRYYLNNFSDGFRQDAIDVFLGKYAVKEGEGNRIESPLTLSKGWRYWTFPSVLLCAMVMFFASAIFPTEYRSENLLFLMFWGAMVGVTTTGIFKYGREFVDWPRLFPPIKIEA